MNLRLIRAFLILAAFFGAVILTACQPKVRQTKIVRAANVSGRAKVEQAEWITYKSDQVLWRVRARDDGHTIESVVRTEEGEVLTLRHERLTRRVLVSQGDAKSHEQSVPEGVFALANGDWPAFTGCGRGVPDAVQWKNQRSLAGERSATRG